MLEAAVVYTCSNVPDSFVSKSIDVSILSSLAEQLNDILLEFDDEKKKFGVLAFVLGGLSVTGICIIPPPIIV